MSKRTSLTFQAQAQGVKVNSAKSTYDKASVDITFRIEAPRQPSPPTLRDWETREARQLIDSYGGVEPGEDAPKDRKKYQAAVAIIKKVETAHATAMARYESQLAAHAPSLMQYAQLVGLMAVFGNQQMTINIKPAGQDLLPGMGYELALPGPDAGDDEDGEL